MFEGLALLRNRRTTLARRGRTKVTQAEKETMDSQDRFQNYDDGQNTDVSIPVA